MRAPRWLQPVLLAACAALLVAGCGDNDDGAARATGTRYVSPSGSDTASGSRERPWRTIQKALDTLEPGQTALVRAGIYRESVVMRRPGRRSAPITLAAYPGERPVIRPAGTGEMDYPVRITSGAAYFRLRRFVIENAPLDTTVNVYVAAQDAPFPHDIEVAGCEIRRSTGTGLLAEPSSLRVRIVGNLVHGNGLGTEHQHQGIYFQGRDGTIERNIVYGQENGFGIQVRGGADGVVVANNTVVRNALSGIVVENTAGNVTVVNNVSAFNGGWAVRGYDSGDGGVLGGNVAHDNLGFGNRSGEFANSDRPVISFGSNNVVADPSFVDEKAHDYRLRPSSPAQTGGDSRYFGGRRGAL
jgi:parallel beta-helix repeat protein